MVWEIPYTFIAGTKAKANEVNGNFTSIKQFIDQLESNLATAELDINNLETNKADINGSQNEVFQVANAENNKDAVNLETLRAQTVNSLDVIRGFIPFMSNATTISCTAGDCWDSTYEQMISSSTALSLQDTALAANTTYYIYVCYDKETSGCKLAFSTNSNTPTLPAGYDYFRKVGSFTTNSSGNIDTVYPIGSVDLSSRTGFIGTYIGALPINSTTVATHNCFVYTKLAGNGSYIMVQINGVEVSYQTSGSKWYNTTTTLIPVKKGQTITIAGNGNVGASVINMI